jgi:hypothetical protein
VVGLSGSCQERTLTRLETGVLATNAFAASEPGSQFQILLIPRYFSLACLSGLHVRFFEELPKEGGRPLTQIKRRPHAGWNLPDGSKTGPLGPETPLPVCPEFAAG